MSLLSREVKTKTGKHDYPNGSTIIVYGFKSSSRRQKSQRDGTEETSDDTQGVFTDRRGKRRTQTVFANFEYGQKGSSQKFGWPLKAESQQPASFLRLQYDDTEMNISNNLNELRNVPEPPERNRTLLTPGFQPCETRNREPAEPLPRLLAYRILRQYIGIVLCLSIFGNLL